VKYPEYCEGCSDDCNENVQKDISGYQPINFIV
jgi:hypothetical protein